MTTWLIIAVVILFIILSFIVVIFACARSSQLSDDEAEKREAMREISGMKYGRREW